MTNYEINALLYGTNSIFHNDGLSIYLLTGKYIDRHEMNFVHTDFEKVKLNSIEEKIEFLPDEFKGRMNRLLNDAVYTAKKYAQSIARQGVLFSHSNLEHSMKPHIHRQAYSDNILPCITVHYRLTGNEPAIFNYWETITQEEAITNDLCRRDTIIDWCNSRTHKSLLLPNDKNVILFNSGLVPHTVTHSDDFNVYFIFDNAVLHDTSLFSSDIPVVIQE
jgi:hypothetical protein